MNKPDVIYMQFDPEDTAWGDPPEHHDEGDVTWADYRVFDTDTEYVRRDVVEAKLAELEARLAAKLKEQL